jgi:putative ABC transport system permease protein
LRKLIEVKAITLIRIAARSIFRNKMRTLLTVLGIVIGVGAVVVMVAIGMGAQSKIGDEIQALGTNMIVITPGASNQGGVSRGAGSFNRLTLDDAKKLAEQSFVLNAVSPVIVAPSQVIGDQGNWRTLVNGVDVNIQSIREWSVETGRFFDQNDVRTMRKVAVIGKTVADNLFPDSDPIGAKIQIRHVPFEVIGVLSEKGQSFNGSDQDDVILAPYTTVNKRLAGRMFIAQILASTPMPDDIPAAKDEARTLMRESHRLSDWEDDDFTVRSQTDIAKAAQNTARVMTLLLAAIAGISLVVGGIGIMNIMLVSVTERTREIGIRMAIGARGSDILTQFLVESVLISAFGGAIGAVVGIAGAGLLGQFMGWRTSVSPETLAVALIFSAGVGVFFGFYPARKAARLNPIEALRYE